MCTKLCYLSPIVLQETNTTIRSVTIESDKLFSQLWSDTYTWLVGCHSDSNYCRSGNFRCKNIFVVLTNHENKKDEIYFTTDNHYSQNISVSFTAQLAIVISRETVSSSTPVGHSSSWQTRDNFSLSVQ